MKEKDTKITRLRNLMSPIINYFKLIENYGEMQKGKNFNEKLLKLVIKERNVCINNIDEIKDIIKQIPNDAIKDE